MTHPYINCSAHTKHTREKKNDWNWYFTKTFTSFCMPQTSLALAGHCPSLFNFCLTPCWKGTLEDTSLCFLSWQDNLENTSLCFRHWKSTLFDNTVNWTSSCFIYNWGIQKGMFAFLLHFSNMGAPRGVIPSAPPSLYPKTITYITHESMSACIVYMDSCQGEWVL